MTQAEFKKTAPQAAGMDYYALLGLSERFAIDLGELERRYLERSRDVHPDRFVNAPAAERVAALQRSMQLNDAYKTLKKPHARAEYLLGRHGLFIGDNEALDPTFLMEVLELREELAEAKARGQKHRLGELEKAMLDRQDTIFGRVASLFADVEASGERAVLAEIKAQLIVLRYIRRYLDEFEDVLDEEGEL